VRFGSIFLGIHAITPCLCDIDKRPTSPAVFNDRRRNCTRLMFDLIERAEKENIPGIIYFEKALDTVEWFFSVRKS
jgi:hypothetical protein